MLDMKEMLERQEKMMKEISFDNKTLALIKIQGLTIDLISDRLSKLEKKINELQNK